MKVKLLLNIGTADNAQYLGLDPEDTKEGSVVDLDQKKANLAIQKGWAAPADAKTVTPTAEASEVKRRPPQI